VNIHFDLALCQTIIVAFRDGAGARLTAGKAGSVRLCRAIIFLVVFSLLQICCKKNT
jgi:hypothetical protein